MKEIKAGKVVLGIVGSLIILIVSQIVAQILASIIAAIHIPIFICNIIAGIMYVAFAFYLLKIYVKKVLNLQMSELGIPRLNVKPKWLLIAFVLRPVLLKKWFSEGL